MPTYEYVCDDCGVYVEFFQSMSDAPKSICPTCSGHLKKQVSAGAGLIFKGTGFYETDYKRKSTSNSNGNGKGKHKNASEKIKTDSAPVKKETTSNATKQPVATTA